jgi:hypothetical protein
MAVQNRVTRGLHLNGSFTWSKSIDSGSATVAGDRFSNSTGSLPFFDLRLSRGLSDFNIGRKIRGKRRLGHPRPEEGSRDCRMGVESRLAIPGCRSLVNPGAPNNYIKTKCFEIPRAPALSFYNQNCDTSMGPYPQCFNLRGNAGRIYTNRAGHIELRFSAFQKRTHQAHQ